MKQRELLYKIYYENKAVNRNLQRLINVGCAGAPGQQPKNLNLREISMGCQ